MLIRSKHRFKTIKYEKVIILSYSVASEESFKNHMVVILLAEVMSISAKREAELAARKEFRSKVEDLARKELLAWFRM